MVDVDRPTSRERRAAVGIVTYGILTHIEAWIKGNFSISGDGSLEAAISGALVGISIIIVAGMYKNELRARAV